MEKRCIIMPLYNDWQSAAILIPRINQAIAQWNSQITVVIVNDGSQEAVPPANELIGDCPHINELIVVHLVCNHGHQRAIAVGLAYAQSRQCFTSVFVMDSDGEDPPMELNDLLAAGRRHPQAIITADRASRSEGPLFRLGYQCYRFLFFLLTGTAIRFGNFSHIPGSQLDKLVYYPDLWNSFSGCIRKSGLPVVGIPSHRATRYIGPSKMNTMALILHGLSAISVLKEMVMVRLLIATALACGLSALVALFSVSLLETPAVPAAATLFCLFALQALLLLLALTFSELQHRSHYQQGPTFFWRKQVKSLEPLKQD